MNPHNILPFDGEAWYYGKIFHAEAADLFLNDLMNDVVWKHDEAIIFGKKIITKRKVAWYGDESFEYKYSGITKKALPWNTHLLQLKKMTEEATGQTYNSCLLNLYHNGSEGMAWHSDAEKDLKQGAAIASLSFGAERKFSFKHKENKNVASVFLEHGSLLVMKGVCQQCWLHRLPPTKKVALPRINLTFRTILH